MEAPARGTRGRRRRGVRGLTVRLLLITVAVLLVGDLLVYFPSVSRFRVEYLHGQLDKARLFTFALETAGSGEILPGDRERLLALTGAEAVVLRTGTGPRLVIGEIPGSVDHVVRLEEPAGTWPAALWRQVTRIPDAVDTLLHGGNRLLRVAGPMRPEGGMTIEMVMREAELARALRGHSLRVLGFLLAFCAVTGGLLFVLLRQAVVRPILRIDRRLESFARTPEDESTTIPVSGRGDEIGQLERSLASMQADLRAALRRRRREAAVGTSVGKINHDLRNLLTVALASADRIDESVAESGDPLLRNVVQHLIGSVNRAAQLCARTLDYIRYGGRTPDVQTVPLRELVSQVGDMVEPLLSGAVRWENRVPEGLICRADSEQLFRALLNLAENAARAAGEGGRVEVSARATGKGVAIGILDSGSGLDDETRALIEGPASAGPGPAGGLGIPIVREIVAAHGGTLRVLQSSPEGTALALMLPWR